MSNQLNQRVTIALEKIQDDLSNSRTDIEAVRHTLLNKYGKYILVIYLFITAIVSGFRAVKLN